MVDLRPDTSIYQHQPQQQSPGGLVDMITRMQEYRERQAIGQATKQHTDPATGLLDVPAATQTYLQNAGDFATPQGVSSFAEGAGKVYAYRQSMMHEALNAVSTMIYDKGATAEKFNATLGTTLRRAGVPEQFIIEAGRAAPGESFRQHLIRIQQWLSNNAMPPTVERLDESGRPVLKLPGEVLDPSAGGGEGGAPPAAAPGGGRKNVTVKAGGMTSSGEAVPAGGEAPEEAVRPPGGDFEPAVSKAPALGRVGFSPEEKKQREDAGEQSKAVMKSGPNINQTRADLRQLDEMSKEAAAGPASDFSKRWSILMNQAKLPELATMTPKEIASTEGYNKIVSRMIDRMGQASGGTTNEYLHNYQASNPSTMMSRPGRSGVVHWLEGLNDTQNLVYREWNAWLAKHPEDQGQFTKWLHSPRGMDAGKFDPRVFQYQRMTPDERKDFRANMTDKDRELFHRHYNTYEKRGWLEQARGE